MNCKSVDDLSVLSREAIITEYSVLYGYHQELKDSEQKQLQEIHQLRRGKMFVFSVNITNETYTMGCCCCY